MLDQLIYDSDNNDALQQMINQLPHEFKIQYKPKCIRLDYNAMSTLNQSIGVECKETGKYVRTLPQLYEQPSEKHDRELDHNYEAT